MVQLNGLRWAYRTGRLYKTHYRGYKITVTRRAIEHVAPWEMNLNPPIEGLNFFYSARAARTYALALIDHLQKEQKQ
jgi:hypothetical protein